MKDQSFRLKEIGISEQDDPRNFKVIECVRRKLRKNPDGRIRQLSLRPADLIQGQTQSIGKILESGSKWLRFKLSRNP